MTISDVFMFKKISLKGRNNLQQICVLSVAQRDSELQTQLAQNKSINLQSSRHGVEEDS